MFPLETAGRSSENLFFTVYLNVVTDTVLENLLLLLLKISILSFLIY